MYKCPRCSESLSTKSCEGIEIDICNKCEGTWLDVNELTLLTEQVQPKPSATTTEEDLTIEPLDKEGEMQCPKCDKVNLNPFIYGGDSGIELDRCPQCEGLWFDKSELDDITAIIADNEVIAAYSDNYKDSDQKMNKYVKCLVWVGKFFRRGSYRR